MSNQNLTTEQYNQLIQYINTDHKEDSLLNLWQEISGYKKLSDKKSVHSIVFSNLLTFHFQRVSKAKELYSLFIKRGAEEEININKDTKHRLKGRIVISDVFLIHFRPFKEWGAELV